MIILKVLFMLYFLVGMLVGILGSLAAGAYIRTVGFDRVSLISMLLIASSVLMLAVLWPLVIAVLLIPNFTEIRNYLIKKHRQ